jgi:hypothetical protein
MKLTVKINAPAWAAPGSPNEERRRQLEVSKLLSEMANRLATCGADTGDYERDELRGSYDLSYSNT